MENSGTVLRLRKLYMILRFQNEIISTRKYEKNDALNTEYTFCMISITNSEIGYIDMTTSIYSLSRSEKTRL